VNLIVVKSGGERITYCCYNVFGLT